MEKMMNVITNPLDLIGRTPVYKLKEAEVYVKLEKYNIAGSVKDRAVKGMLDAARQAGLVKEDTILVEATSGNTGIALAMLGAIYGLKVVIIMPESMSKERRELVKAYGAQLILTPASEGMKGSIAKAEAILKENDKAIMLGQFDNKANGLAHYEGTAEEILAQVPDVSIFVAGIGTAGTFVGNVQKLKEKNPNLLAVAVEPANSPIISQGKAGAHKIQGIGAGFVPANMDLSVMDEVMTVTDEAALKEVQTFMAESGISIGISAGAAIWAAKQLARTYPGKKVVTIAPDGVEKYLSMLAFEEVEYIK